MDHYLTLDKAARARKINKSILRSLIDSGKLRAVMVEGNIVVDEQDLYSGVPKEERPEYNAQLKGIGISMSEAGRKYSISTRTISRWFNKGLIALICKIGNKILIDEADVAYCAAIYKQRPGRGKWPFNPDGTPYRVTTIRKR